MRRQKFWPEPLSSEEIDKLGDPWDNYDLDSDFSFPADDDVHLALFELDGTWFVFRQTEYGDTKAWSFTRRNDATRAFEDLLINGAMSCFRTVWGPNDVGLIAVGRGAPGYTWEADWTVVWLQGDTFGQEQRPQRMEALLLAAEVAEEFAEDCDDPLEGHLVAAALRRRSSLLRAEAWEAELGKLLREANSSGVLGRHALEHTRLASNLDVSRALYYRVLRGQIWRDEV